MTIDTAPVTRPVARPVAPARRAPVKPKPEKLTVPAKPAAVTAGNVVTLATTAAVVGGPPVWIGLAAAGAAGSVGYAVRRYRRSPARAAKAWQITWPAGSRTALGRAAAGRSTGAGAGRSAARGNRGLLAGRSGSAAGRSTGGRSGAAGAGRSTGASRTGAGGWLSRRGRHAAGRTGSGSGSAASPTTRAGRVARRMAQRTARATAPARRAAWKATKATGRATGRRLRSMATKDRAQAKRGWAWGRRTVRRWLGRSTPETEAAEKAAADKAATAKAAQDAKTPARPATAGTVDKPTSGSSPQVKTTSTTSTREGTNPMATNSSPKAPVAGGPIYQAARRFRGECASHTVKGTMEHRNEAYDFSYALAELAEGVRARVAHCGQDAVEPAYMQLLNSIAGMVDTAAASAKRLGPAFDDLHRKEIGRILHPRNGEAKWDTTVNRG